MLVPDTRPYETMKLRLLNGGHSALAYLGLLRGHETVADGGRRPRAARVPGAAVSQSSRRRSTRSRASTSPATAPTC